MDSGHKSIGTRARGEQICGGGGSDRNRGGSRARNEVGDDKGDRLRLFRKFPFSSGANIHGFMLFAHFIVRVHGAVLHSGQADSGSGSGGDVGIRDVDSTSSIHAFRSNAP